MVNYLPDSMTKEPTSVWLTFSSYCVFRWLCWYWWNCWPSWLNLYFHNHISHRIVEYQKDHWLNIDVL